MVINVFQACILYCAVISPSQEKASYPNVSPYPTNFFTETYKKFVNDRPLIGIVSMPMDGDKILYEYPNSWDKEYFGASFVKLIESVGGRAVPVTEV